MGDGVWREGGVGEGDGVWREGGVGEGDGVWREGGVGEGDGVWREGGVGDICHVEFVALLLASAELFTVCVYVCCVYL